MNINTVGSICSGIEAASVAWKPFGFKFEWFSEIADFPSRVLKSKYEDIPNLGDMNNIPKMLINEEINIPDMICGGTPCQAFSLAGWKEGLNDDRGNLTLKFVDIIKANDNRRKEKGLSNTIVFWENVEGVLTDKTNAFGCLISSLAGLNKVIVNKRWPSAGIVRGPERNIAWRVLDAKFFGVPQQRKRLYVLAGGTDFYPENVLFETHTAELLDFPKSDLIFDKDGHKFEVFREYTDCMYSAYGTKWNGNAAAYNGSLFVVQDERIRRLSALECERLMGFPDNYTDLPKARKTNRYQAVGNSWAVPVVKWIGGRLVNYSEDLLKIDENELLLNERITKTEDNGVFFDFGKDIVQIREDKQINCTPIPEASECVFSEMRDIVSADAPEDIYISPVGCFGIVRRKQERNLRINERLEEVLLNISSQMSLEEIEKRSRVQKRGRFSKPISEEAKLNLIDNEKNEKVGQRSRFANEVINEFNDFNGELISYGYTIKDEKIYALKKQSEKLMLWVSKNNKDLINEDDINKAILNNDGNIYVGTHEEVINKLMCLIL
ncbi:DNA cytosine methyltransferase [uncultured Clostridium sp.]|uniref:DNA cytosine methyltransferase n=1 Tax=uncultured Clostridium sp. TaxID=59620 RepID=UPI0025CDD23F|nr:DNA cytosine methyltransferase [uncultured Clostridium sp.]